MLRPSLSSLMALSADSRSRQEAAMEGSFGDADSVVMSEGVLLHCNMSSGSFTPNTNIDTNAAESCRSTVMRVPKS